MGGRREKDEVGSCQADELALEILLQGTRLSRSRFSLRQVCGLAEIRSGNGNEIAIVTVPHLHSSHVLDY